MDCEHAVDMLMAYLDDELGPPDAGRVAAHLASCQACRAERDAVRTTLDMLHRADDLTRHEAAAPLMTPDEVAALLRLTREQFRRVAPLLPTIDLAGEKRYLRDSIMAWLRCRAHIPAEDGALPGPLTPSFLPQTPRSIAFL